MSWMDSWSRPNKSAVTPPPFYLTPGRENTPYCHSCGRVISSRKTETTKSSKTTPVKYCSERCKNNKPGKVDRRIEAAFVALLDGADPAQLPVHLAADAPLPSPQGTSSTSSTLPQSNHSQQKKKKYVKGDPRLTIMCLDVEELIFGSRFNPEKTHGRKRNKAKRNLGPDEDEDGLNYGNVSLENGEQSDEGTNGSTVENSADNSEDEGHASDAGSAASSTVSAEGGGVPLPIRTADDTTTNSQHKETATTVLSDHKNFGAGKTRPAQLESEVNFSVGGERGWAEKLEETPEMLAKRREGQRKAEEREMVRCAARRLCAFGYAIEGGEKDGGGKEVESEKEKEGRGGGKKKGKKGGKGNDDGEIAPATKTVVEKRKKCEALMKEVVVESSLAKGEFGIRWREEQDL